MTFLFFTSGLFLGASLMGYFLKAMCQRILAEAKSIKDSVDASEQLLEDKFNERIKAIIPFWQWQIEQALEVEDYEKAQFFQDAIDKFANGFNS